MLVKNWRILSFFHSSRRGSTSKPKREVLWTNYNPSEI